MASSTTKFSSVLLESYSFDPITNNKTPQKVRAKVGADPKSTSDPPFAVDDTGLEFAKWDPNNNVWRSNSEYAKNFPNVPTGQSADSFVYDNRKTLSQAATYTINNNFTAEEAKDIAKFAYSPGVIGNTLIEQDPAAGSDFGADGQPQNVETTSSDTVSTPDQLLKYPLNNNDEQFDFLKITEAQYQPPGLSSIRNQGNFGSRSTEERTVNLGGSVILPMHPGISDSNSVGWGDDSLNPIQAAFGQAASNAIGDAANAKNMSDIGNVLKNIMGDTFDVIGTIGADGNSGKFIQQYFAGQAVGANIVGRTTGLVLNPNLELLFTGPNLRTFSYSYQLTPRDEAESEVIRKIVLFFKKAMSAVKSNTSLFLKTPSVFKLEYIYGKTGGQHPFLNKIKTCALTSFNVDYTPDGSYMTYNDNGSMTSYNISMSFSELEPIYRNDYDSTDDMGY